MKGRPDDARGKIELTADAPPRGTPDDRYGTFLALSGDGIARLVLDPPLDVDAPDDRQVDHLLRHSRIAECNEPFARFYGRRVADLAGQRMADLVPSDDPARLEGFREFVRARYRLASNEEEHALPGGSSRWMIGSALGAIVDGRLRSYWLCLRDITEQKRAEAERERRGRILEAVAFSAARLLEPGRWEARAGEVLARLGQAADVSRLFVAKNATDPDGALRGVPYSEWAAPGLTPLAADPRFAEGVRWLDVGWGHWQDTMRRGEVLVGAVSRLSEGEKALFTAMGVRSFASVPILVDGEWWGLLGFHETRFEQEWSGAQIEALKAAAAVFSAAIQRERADAALRESEERFERLSAAAFEGIAITEGGVFVDANEQLARMLGGGVGDLVGRTVPEFVVPEDRERVKESLTTASEEPYQHLARRRDGSVFPVEVRARSMPHRGRTVRVSAVRDVSARVQGEERQRRLEAELRQAAEEWRQTFDALDLGIVLADSEGRIVRLNRGALELAMGPAHRDAVGRKLDELPGEEPWRTALEVQRQVRESRTSVTAEALEASSGRSFFFLGSAWLRGEGQPPGCVLTFRDVTHYTTMQEQLRRARTMEAMGSLVAGVAHEVRNPLFSISATVDALESELGPRLEFTEYADLLRSQVDRLSQLMRDLLDYGKPSVLRRGPTSLAEVVRRAVRSCATLAREREVRVDEDIASDLPSLDVDGARVEQALENLIANALQHAPAGSAVRVGGSLDLAGREPQARCTVEDEGPGLPEENRGRIFEPFFSRRKGGTGLGLSIVQRVALAHGGDVTAENRPEGGARFTLLLPVGGPAARADGGPDA